MRPAGPQHLAARRAISYAQCLSTASGESAMSTTNAEIAGIRTIALVGQTTAGKTSLVESLLWKAGAIGAPGSLERGTTVCDFDPLERRGEESLNPPVRRFLFFSWCVAPPHTPRGGALPGCTRTALA